eukprot:5785444-Alexandrium_andersonii.AAC.1
MGGPEIPRRVAYRGPPPSSGGPLTGMGPARRCGLRRLPCPGWPRPRRPRPGAADSPLSWRSLPPAGGLGCQ